MSGHTKKTCSPLAPANDSVDILSSNHWKNTNAFKHMQKKETQKDYYLRMKANDDVLRLVELESKPFGTVCENIISEIFGLSPRTSSEHDGILCDKKIEIKTARYWAGKDDCRWQHLEPDHDYEFALFVILDFQGWKVWGIKKSVLMSADVCNVEKVKKSDKPVNFQGKQGWWTTKSAILPYLTEIRTASQLKAFVQKIL